MVNAYSFKNKMRSQLINVLKQTVKTSQRFNDYNFRSYFVRKYSNDLAAVESNEGMTVTQELLEQAQRYKTDQWGLLFILFSEI
jgi:hypothetical protein